MFLVGRERLRGAIGEALKFPLIPFLPTIAVREGYTPQELRVAQKLRDALQRSMHGMGEYRSAAQILASMRAGDVAQLTVAGGTFYAAMVSEYFPANRVAVILKPQPINNL